MVRPATTHVSRMASSSFTHVWYIFHEFTFGSLLLAFNWDAFHKRKAHTLGFVSRCQSIYQFLIRLLDTGGFKKISLHYPATATCRCSRHSCGRQTLRWNGRHDGILRKPGCRSASSRIAPLRVEEFKENLINKTRKRLAKGVFTHFVLNLDAFQRPTDRLPCPFSFVVVSSFLVRFCGQLRNGLF